MGTYKWEKIEHTCDGCSIKVMGADRENELPRGWTNIKGTYTHESETGGCTSSRNIDYHFCSKECMQKILGGLK